MGQKFTNYCSYRSPKKDVSRRILFIFGQVTINFKFLLLFSNFVELQSGFHTIELLPSYCRYCLAGDKRNASCNGDLILKL